jgi:hypothetical protein
VATFAVLTAAALALPLHPSAGIALEQRAGQSPSATPDAPRELRWGSEVSPSLGLEGRDLRTELMLRYSAQLAAAEPMGLAEPMVTHELAALGNQRLARDTAVYGDLTGMVGNLTFDRALRYAAETGDLIATFPREDVVSYANLDAGLGLRHEITRRLAWNVDLRAGYTGPTPGDDDGLLMPQERTSLGGRGSYELSARDEVGADLTVGWTTFANGPAYISVVQAARYRRALSHDSQLRLRAGAQATFGRTLASDMERVPSFVPVGSIDFTTTMVRTRGGTLDLKAGAAVTPFYDPFEGVLYPRGSLSSSLVLDRRQATSVRLSVQAFRLLEEPRGRVIYPEAVGVASLALIRPFGPTLSAELGGVATLRQDAGSETGSPDLLAYVALAAALGAAP